MRFRGSPHWDPSLTNINPSSKMGCFQSKGPTCEDVCSYLTSWDVTDQSSSHMHQAADILKRGLRHGLGCVGTCCFTTLRVYPMRQNIRLRSAGALQSSGVSMTLYSRTRTQSIHLPLSNQVSVYPARRRFVVSSTGGDNRSVGDLDIMIVRR